MTPRHPAMSIALWAVTVPLVLLYLTAGVPKLLGSPDAMAGFEHFGYPQWFRVVVGVVEVVGALALLWPRVTAVAAAALAAVMAGAAWSHVRVGESPDAALPAILCVLLVAIAWVRWPDMFRGRRDLGEPGEAPYRSI